MHFLEESEKRLANWIRFKFEHFKITHFRSPVIKMRLTPSLFRCSVIFFDLANYFDKYLEFEIFGDKIKQEPVPDSSSCWRSFEDHRLSMELNVFFVLPAR